MTPLTRFYIQILDPSKEALTAGCETIVFHATDAEVLNYEVQKYNREIIELSRVGVCILNMQNCKYNNKINL